MLHDLSNTSTYYKSSNILILKLIVSSNDTYFFFKSRGSTIFLLHFTRSRCVRNEKKKNSSRTAATAEAWGWQPWMAGRWPVGSLIDWDSVGMRGAHGDGWTAATAKCKLAHIWLSAELLMQSSTPQSRQILHPVIRSNFPISSYAL